MTENGNKGDLEIINTAIVASRIIISKITLSEAIYSISLFPPANRKLSEIVSRYGRGISSPEVGIIWDFPSHIGESAS